MRKVDLSGYPDILFIEELSVVLGKAATTIRTCATNAKYAHLIPRPFKLPGSRRLRWHKDDVVAWMDRAKIVQPARKPMGQRGPSLKPERVAAEKAGMTVKEWRRSQHAHTQPVHA